MKPLLELVKKWAEINSHSHNLLGLKEMRQELLEAFSPLADESATTDKNVLHFKKRVEGKKRLVLIGHYDTVYPENFPIAVKDKFLYGPGVADMKGGLAIILYAVKALKNDFSWDVLLNPDEEIGSGDSMPYLTEVAKGADYGFIFEPALPDGTLVSSRPSSGSFRITALGVEAHAGRNPEKGKSATLALCELLYHLSFLKREDILYNIGTIAGGTAPNVVAAEASAKINLRTQKDEDFADALQVISEIIQEMSNRHGVSFNLETIAHRPAKILTTKTKLLMKQFEQVYGVPFEPSRGACDANNLTHLQVPFIDSLGPIGFDLHSPKEHLLISSLEERLNLFLKALKVIEIF